MSPVVANDLSFESEPPRRGIAGLPYGWFPILISSIAFGLAHFGYGPEPVPLFLLALVLGHLYQRTHRIIPGIVAHALFNLFSMIILWRVLYHHG
jgi:membrane protease YdiL (CAAX protease family)